MTAAQPTDTPEMAGKLCWVRGHPEKKEDDDAAEKTFDPVEQLQRATASQSATKQQAGGREFGNVIEPMQAQMASENQGLAVDVGTDASDPMPKKTTHSKKSAV